MDALHRETRGADAGQDDPVRAGNHVRVVGDGGGKAQPLEGDPDGAEIAAAQIDEGELHRTPFVLGSALPSRRMAGRSARPKALKQASTLW